MAKTTRIHLLAKELGVENKAIVAKCQAEGLSEIKNHMAVISMGLAETIRQWFSEGANTTAVEETAPVDLKKVRVKKKKTVEPAQENEPVVAEGETAPPTAAVVEVEAVAPPAEAAVADVNEQIAEPTAAEPEAPPVQEPTEIVIPEPEPVVAPPPPPVVIKPAGPMLHKPQPAKLTGPTIVRVEAAEEDTRHRPSGRGKPSHAPRTAPPSRTKTGPVAPKPLLPGETPPPDKGSGRKVKDKTHGRRKGGSVDEGRGEHGATGVKRLRSRDIEERRARLAAAGSDNLRVRPSRRIEGHTGGEAGMPTERPEKAVVHEPITIKDLSAALGVKASDIITKLLKQGIMATANRAIATDVAELVAMEFGTELVVEHKRTSLELIEQTFESRSREHLQKRPPVVTMLGHVDHGKTSLLDRIRQTHVASGEAGGITQHIGAYQIEIHGKKITFLDTPGHEAFTSMRARGANMTDIVVLVVAADDGLMPQTIEAIHHAKAAGVTIIVALNKIDLPGLDINRILGQLAEHDVTPSEWGGETEIVKTSATTGQGVDDLLENIDLAAELKDYQADSTIPACGWVVEANMSPTKGPVATVLIKEGHLDKGDVILAGGVYGRVRTMIDSRGRSVKTAGPSAPVVLTGLDGVPQAGDKFYCLSDINQAKQAAEETERFGREKALAKRSQVTLENLFTHIAAGRIKELNLIVKADVQGSVDVLNKYLTEISTEEVRVRIIHSGVGGINESDAVLAEASGAIIIGFNVVPEDRIRQMADAKGVNIRLYNIIYRITEDLKAAMIGMLEPDTKENVLGRAVVRNTFKVSSIGTIAGCYVTNGVIQKNAKLRLIRDNIVIRDNCTIESLKHFKDDVREVRTGLECGIKVANFDDIKNDDIFEAFEIVQVKRTSL